MSGCLPTLISDLIRGRRRLGLQNAKRYGSTQSELASAPAVGLAAHAVVVSVEMRAVAGVSPMYGCRTGCPCLIAVAERSLLRSRPRTIERLLPCRCDLQRCRGRWRAMAVIAAILPVVVAAVPVETAAMRLGIERGQADEREKTEQSKGSKSFHLARRGCGTSAAARFMPTPIAQEKQDRSAISYRAVGVEVLARTVIGRPSMYGSSGRRWASIARQTRSEP